MIYVWFGLVWFLCLMAYQLFLSYLMPKPFSSKNSSGTIYTIAGRIRGFIPFPVGQKELNWALMLN